MSLIWGIPYLFIRVAVAEVTPATLVFARTGIASLILLPLAARRGALRPALARWPWVVAFAVVEVGVPWVFLGFAEERLASSVAALLVAGVPLVGSVVAVVTRGRDRLGTAGIVGLIVGLVGVAAVVGVDAQASNIAALLAMAVVVVGYAVGPAILARRLGGISSLGVMSIALSLCALVYAPIAFVQRPAQLPGPDVLLAIVILAVVCTAAAFVIFSALIEAIGPVRATVITYVNPAVASLLGVAVLGEPFTLLMLGGFGLVILGSALATGLVGLPPRRVAAPTAARASALAVETVAEPTEPAA